MNNFSAFRQNAQTPVSVANASKEANTLAFSNNTGFSNASVNATEGVQDHKHSVVVDAARARLDVPVTPQLLSICTPRGSSMTDSRSVSLF